MATLTPEDVQFQIAHWDDDKGPLVTTITTIFMVFAMIAVVLRLVTRKVIIKISWQVDDYAIIVAMISAVGFYAGVLLSVHYGTGKHVLKVGIDNTVKIVSITFALELIYNFCHLAIKISLLFLYRAVLTLNNPRFKIAWYAIGAYVVAFAIATMFGALLQCTPIHYGWDRLYGRMQGRCVDLKAEVLSTAVLNTLADVALLILPIPTLWNLQMPLKQKLGLCVIFLLGILACIASVIRIQYVARVEEQIDFTYIEVDTLTWSMVEPCVGISCACLSTLRPMFRVLRDSAKRSKFSSSKFMSTSRSLFHGSRQRTSTTLNENPTSEWGGLGHDAQFKRGDSTVAFKGLSNIEMRGMGYNSLDTDRSMA